MKKRIKGFKLSREKDSRKALSRSLIRALVEHGKIQTTLTKAKFIQNRIEKLVNIAKNDNQVTRRRVFAYLGNDNKTTNKLFSETQRLFKDIAGGYTQIFKLTQRRGDGATPAIIQWSKQIPLEPEVTKKSSKTKEKSKNPAQKIKRNLSKIKRNKK